MKSLTERCARIRFCGRCLIIGAIVLVIVLSVVDTVWQR